MSYALVIWILLAALALGRGLGWVLVRRHKGRQARFFQKLETLSGAGSGWNRILDAGGRGRGVKLDYQVGGRNEPATLSLIVHFLGGGSFRVEPCGLSDRMFEGMGLAGRIATPDSQFDARWRIV
jgi:hypothetical protein